MASRRERVLSALFARLRTLPGAEVRRNEALPASVPPGGLVVLRDGDPGEPDVTLNPRTAFYAHRAEIEVFLAQPVPGSQPGDGSGEEMLDDLLGEIEAVLAVDPGLGGLAEHIHATAPEVSAVAIEGAAPILSARLVVVIEYLVGDPPTL